MSMIFLPGWDSLETVARIHRFFEVAGIVCLAGLVGAEVVAYIYGHRKDELLAAQQTARDSAIAERHQREMENAKKQQDEASKKMSALEERQAPRSLSTKQQQMIVEALRPHTGHVVSITMLGDAEAKAYAEQIIRSLSLAGWKPAITFVGVMAPPDYGVICTVSDQAGPAARALVSALQRAGIKPEVRVEPIQPDQIQLLIGLKPPS